MGAAPGYAKVIPRRARSPGAGEGRGGTGVLGQRGTRPTQAPGLGRGLLQGERQGFLPEIVEQGRKFRGAQTQAPEGLYFSQHLGRGTVSHYLPVIKKDNPGAMAGQAQVRAQQDQGEVVVLAESSQGLQEFLHPQGIEVRGRFIQDQDAGFQGQDPGQGQELLLAAGEGGRVLFSQARKPHPGQGALHPERQFLPVQTQIFRAEGHLQVGPGAKDLGLKVLEEKSHPVRQFPGAAEMGKAPRHLHPAPEFSFDHPGDEAAQTEGQGGFARLRWDPTPRPALSGRFPGSGREKQELPPFYSERINR